jgi:long-chain acyl-CoA synthetase
MGSGWKRLNFFLKKVCHSYNFITIPLYETLGEESIKHIIKLINLKIILCSSDKIDLILKHSQNIVKYIIVFDDVDFEKFENNDIKILKYKDILNIGKLEQISFNPPTPDDISLICFTSGIYFFYIDRYNR